MPAVPTGMSPGSSFGGLSPATTQTTTPLLRVVNNAQMDDAAKAQQQSLPVEDVSSLTNYVRSQYEMMRNHRNDGAAGWAERLNAALRAFNGTYDPQKSRDIKQFGGSDIYARVTAQKCRGANSLLRDIYLAPDRPWAVEPPADPDVPPEILQQIGVLIQSELAGLYQNAAVTGEALPTPGQIRDRSAQLLEGAKSATRKQADKRMAAVQNRMDEILEGGGFYKALAEFLVDLPIFPYAIIKGPVVRIIPTVSWSSLPPNQGINPSGGVGPQDIASTADSNAEPVSEPRVVQQPRLTWERVSPFDVYWTPGASDIEQASVIQRSRLTRAELNDLLDLPGYDTAAVRQALDDYGRGGITLDWDSTDSERAMQERRESPLTNRSGMIDMLEFHGNVQGRLLLDLSAMLVDALEGFNKQPLDALRDYHVQVWVIGRYVIKVQLTPSPRQHPPYYITSFEKVPGTPVGNALPDLLADVQDAANAVLRALVNNMSIASGPQVVISEDRLAPGENADNLFPWKRWRVLSDPMSSNAQPAISFFQPNSNAAELLGVFQAFISLADDISAIPKYITGQGASSGAGRTASGLSMLMSNASKLLQTVAGNVDRDVMRPALTDLYEMLMLTDRSGLLRGDETIRVMGVNVAIQKETQRIRQLEFLSITANPLDAPIMGPKGRATILRSVADTIGLDGSAIIPDQDELERQANIQKQQTPIPSGEAAQQAQGTGGAGTQGGATSTGNMGPTTRLAGGVG